MVTLFNTTLAIPARDTIGEGPSYDAVGRRLLWSDNATGIVHEAKSNEVGGWQETRRWELPPSYDAPIPRYGTALPRENGGLIVVGGTEVVFLDEAGRLTPFVRLPADPNLVRLNDAKCDSRGRLWVGTISTDLTQARGALYRIDPDGTINKILSDVTSSNGLDWSPDGSTFYYIDSVSQAIDAFDFDAERGVLSNRRTLVTIKVGEGVPDGMTTDSEGCLWVALAGGGEVRQYEPDGTLVGRVLSTAPVVTSCAFGGVDFDTLFVTSAALRLPERFREHGFSAEVVENSHKAPGAGGVFVCQPGKKGKPANPFAG